MRPSCSLCTFTRAFFISRRSAAVGTMIVVLPDLRTASTEVVQFSFFCYVIAISRRFDVNAFVERLAQVHGARPSQNFLLAIGA